jgi:hypothetical protein
VIARTIPGFRPTPTQESLLRAALLADEDAARAAWRVWRETERLDDVDAGSFRVLPLLSERLQSLVPDEPALSIVRGVHRQSSYRNRLLLDRATPVLAALQRRGIPTIVTKGAALAQRYYPDAGMRSLVQFDVIVRRRDAAAAHDAVVTSTPWRTTGRHPAAATEAGLLFRNPDGFFLHLLTHVLAEVPDDAVDASFWQRSVPFEHHGVATRVLDHTDELFRVCLEAGHWLAQAPLLWISDALALLRAPATPDWAHFVHTARRVSLVLAVREALDYLVARFDAPVPAEALERLNALPVSGAERREYRFNTKPRALLGELAASWYRYRLRLDGSRNPLRVFAGFARYQTRLRGLPSVMRLPGSLLAALPRKLMGRAQD